MVEIRWEGGRADKALKGFDLRSVEAHVALKTEDLTTLLSPSAFFTFLIHFRVSHLGLISDASKP